MAGLVDPRAGLGDPERRRFLTLPGLELRPLVIQPVVSLYTDYGIRLSVNIYFFNLCGGTLGTAAIACLLYQPRMIGDGGCREIGEMKIGKGNRSTRS
jgi:hypothetical protein